MNKPPYNYHGINPENVIDLRPKPSRLTLTWQDLTAVRIITFIGRLILRLVIVAFDLFYRLVKSLAEFFVDLVFGVKDLALNLKYTGAEQGIKLKRFFLFIFNFILIIPRAIVKLILRIFNLFKKTTNRVEIGLKRESKILAKPVVKQKPNFSWQILNFAALLCLIAAPFFLVTIWQKLEPTRNSIISSANEAFAGLFSAKDLIEKKNFSGAETAFEKAGEGFVTAQTNLKDINSGLLELAGLVPDKKFKLASESEHLLKAGSLSASIGAELAAAVAPVANSNLGSYLDRFVKHAIPAADEAAALSDELNKIKLSNLPTEYQEKFTKLKSQAEFLAPSLREAIDLSQQAASFLGKQTDKRYLLVFQNNSEKRASGGFIGSFAIVDFSKGEMKNLTVPKGGSYDTEAGLYTRVVAPEPLWLLNPLWHFWDANWWPDWPTTAKKLEWFYEKSDGSTVDGVVSLTPTVIENLLRVHGPVDMTKDYGVTITADNFWETTQTFSEQKPSVTKEPKKIIGDLMSKLMEELPKNLDLAKSLALVGVLEQSLNEKQILLYFNDSTLETSAKAFGWDGAIKKTDHDYLMVVSSNLGGQKSDRAIIETLNHSAEILPDGQIIVNLTITRQHTAPKNQTFVGFRNVDWLRVYVPEDSKLISATGWRTPEQSYFEKPDPKWELDVDLANERQAITDPASGTKIYKENNKTVFANWTMVDPGETATIEIKYRLPFTLKANEEPKNLIGKIKKYIFPDSSNKFSLLVQKQPGANQTSIVSKIVIDRGWKTLWKYPDDLQVNESGWTLSRSLNTDLYATVLFNKN
ncbi:MAG: DUF4012 domain-containing protein [Candidatus Falkowbacteria bacterium]|nr:DUF4012 domain-containing protein [Candidatus Falkowbacteria bacterium]